jgi:hypothetical protein
LDEVRTLLRRHPAVGHVELAAIEELPAALRHFSAQGIDVLAVNGGDGTVQAAMSLMLNGPVFDRPVALAAVPAGRTNLIALDVGARGDPRRALARLLDGAAGEGVERQVLSLTRAPGEAAVHGMFFGTAAFYRATEWARRRLEPYGSQRSLSVGLAIALLLGRSLLGQRGSDGIFAGDRIRLDAGPGPTEGEYFIIIATTLHRLILGLWPFWGNGLGLRYTSIAFPPRHLARAAVPLLRGRPRRWMLASGYRSGMTERMTFVLAVPVVLDGEIFQPEPGNPVVLEANRSLRFLRW